MKKTVLRPAGSRSQIGDGTSGFYQALPDKCTRLEIRMQQSRVSLPYYEVGEINYGLVGDDLEDIVLYSMSRYIIRITGKNLGPLFEAFQEEKVKWIRELRDKEKLPDSNYIETIEFYPLADWSIILQDIYDHQTISDALRR